MTRGLGDGEYVRTARFDCGEVRAVAGGDDCVALATASGEIRIVTASGERPAVTLPGPATDLALGTRLYALVDGEVLALSEQGTRVWSVSAEGGEGIALVRSHEVVAIRTGTEVVGLDGETGTELFRVERPYADVAGEPFFVGGAERFAFATWTFLTTLAPDGTVEVESSFDGKVECVGTVGDRVVVALKNDRLVCIDERGEHRWERDCAVETLAGAGGQRLVVATDGALETLSVDGACERLGDAEGYPVVAAYGEPLCLVADGTVTAYRTGGSLSSLEASVAETLPAGAERVDLRVTNGGDAAVATTLDLRAEWLSLGRATIDLDLDAGETTTVDVPIETVTADDRARILLERDGESVAEAAVTIESDPLAVEAALERIEDGTAYLDADVTNRGATPATGLSVVPGGPDDIDLDGGETRTVRVALPFDDGRYVTLTLGDDDRDVRVETAVRLPDEPLGIDVESAGDGFVDVEFRNDGPVAVEDRVTVSGVGPTIERRIELDPASTFVLALGPTAEVGRRTVAVTVEGLGIGQHAEIHVESADGRTGRRGPGAGTATELGDVQADSPHDEAVEFLDDGARVVVEREISDTQPVRYQRVTERLVIANDGSEDLTNLRLDCGDESVELGTLEPGDRRAVDQYHAFPTTGSVELPGCSVASAEGASATVEPRSLSVGTGDLSGTITVEVADEGLAVELWLENRRETPCTVRRIGVEGVGIWRTNVPTVAPGSTIEWERHAEDGEEPTDSAVPAAIEYAFPDADSRRFQTLATVNGQSGATAFGPLDVTIDPETRVAEDGGGMVILAIENESDTAVTDVEVEATGGPIRELLYGGTQVEPSLSPGERLNHRVDVDPTGEPLRLPFVVEATVGGQRRAWDAVVEGPVPAAVEEWDEDVFDGWRVVGGTAASGWVRTGFRDAN